MNSFIELASQRYSVRSFSEKAVEEEKIDEILKAAQIAPTAGNRQPHRIKIVCEKEELEKIDACTACRFGAGHVFIVCYDKTECWTRSFDGATSGDVDASIIATHIILAAQDVGLGTCWVMYFDPKKVCELFNLPENIVPVALIPTGYPSESSAPSDRHTSRKNIAEILL